MSLDWTIYVKAYRDPTLRDVEEQAKKIGVQFWVETIRHPVVNMRRYWMQGKGVSDPELLQEVSKGVRPDWRAMLKKLGSDWA